MDLIEGEASPTTILMDAAIGAASDGVGALVGGKVVGAVTKTFPIAGVGAAIIGAETSDTVADELEEFSDDFEQGSIYIGRLGDL